MKHLVGCMSGQPISKPVRSQSNVECRFKAVALRAAAATSRQKLPLLVVYHKHTYEITLYCRGAAGCRLLAGQQNNNGSTRN
jgi:hypothetical protein